MKASVRWLLSLGFLGLTACGGGGGDQGLIVFNLSLVNLPDLGPQRGHYEGFALVDGVARSTGKFIVDSTFSPSRISSPDKIRVYGNVDLATFGPAFTGIGEAFPFIQDATGFYITVEPENDANFEPSGNVVMAGNFVGTTCALDTVGLTAAGGPGLGNFTQAAGSVLLVNATGSPGNDASGIWFTLDPAGTMPSLTLPAPTGLWNYEAWVDIGGTPYSLGKFRSTTARDQDAELHPGRGTANIGLNLPGQDFLFPATVGASEVIDLASGQYRVEISVEPVDDNSLAQFPLIVMSASIPTDSINAIGRALRDVPIFNQTANLPALNAAIVAPDRLDLNGRVPRGFNSPREGTLACWAEIAGVSSLVARFVVNNAVALVTSPDGLVVYGSVQGGFSFTASNTGLGPLFPNLNLATRFFITQEAQGSSALLPSSVVLLSGLATSGQAALTVAGAIVPFTPAQGTFVLMTPTDDETGATNNDGFGLWFRFLGGPVPSLFLPTLPAGYTYEGWIASNLSADRWSMGRFRRTDRADDDAMTFRGRGPSNTGFNVPGQDFVSQNQGTTLPALPDLRGLPVLVTLEPVPDNSLAPFVFPLLAGNASNVALVPGPPLANVTANYPTGTVHFDP